MKMADNRVDRTLDDETLVRGCVRNDRRIQRALFEQYKVAFYTLACRLVHDPELSRDVLQEAFLEIYRSIGTFRFRSSLYSWMRTLVVRAALAALRQNPPLVREDVEEWDGGNTPGFDFEAEHLEKAIESLPGQTRTVFVLVELEGYKHREVGEMLGISSGTSKSQLNYAKKLLRNRLTGKQDASL
ncbi:MAG: RNA polymerase sigma factor [Bacteroidales bacterium]